MTGEWTVGTRLPSQRELARLFGVNRSTIVAASEELAALGLLEGQTGAGTRVANASWGLLAGTSPPDWEAYVERGSHAPNYPTIQEINAAEFRPGMIRLGTGELSPELLPEQEIAALLASGGLRQQLPLGYEEPQGSRFLREQLAEKLGRDGIPVSADSILVVSGALQALQLIAVGLLKPGATVMTESPSYLYSLKVMQSAGMKLQGLPMDGQGLQASVLGAYRRQFHGAILYTIPTFHNPTGTVMSLERRQELLAVCREERLPVIEDDVYRDLWLDCPSPPPLKSMDKSGNVLYLGSMSKTTSPGLRIGWVAGPQSVIERLADIKMQTDYGASSLSQWAAAEWLAGGHYDSALIRLREQLRIRRRAASQALDRHFSGLAEWTVPAGGFYIWLRLNRCVPAKRLFEQALAQGVLLNPGYLYGEQEQRSLRISYSYANPEQLSYAVGLLAQLVSRM